MFKFKQAWKLRPYFYSFCKQIRFNKASIRDENFAPEKPAFDSAIPNIQSGVLTQNDDAILLKERFNKVLEAIEGSTAKNTFMYDRIVMEFHEIFKISDQIIHNKENALKLINLLVKFRIDAERVHFIKKARISNENSNQFFLLSHESPENFLLFSKTWERVLIKANFALKDQDLLFETVYQIPRTFSENIDMQEYVEQYLNSSKNTIPICQVLFFLTKLSIQKKRKSIPTDLINLTLKRYSEIKNSLFDLGMLNFIYYQFLSKHFISVQNINKWNMAQKATFFLEAKFQKASNIDITPILRNEEDKNQSFSELILREAFEFMEKFERGEVDISEKVFIQSLVFFFKSFSKFSILNQKLCELVDQYALKYQKHFSIIDKYTLLMTYAKNLNIVPEFAALFEKDIHKTLLFLSLNLEHKQKLTLNRKSIDNVFMNEEYYTHLKRGCDPNFSGEHFPALFGGNDTVFDANQLHEIYWYLGKTNINRNLDDLIKVTNNLYNLWLKFYTKYQIFDGIQSACALSLMDQNNVVDWKKDFKIKLESLAEKLEKWEPLKVNELSLYSTSSLYKNLVFIKMKFDIDAFQYFNQGQLEYLKREWFNSSKRYKPPYAERKIYDILKKYLKNQGINRNVYFSKVVDLFFVNVFIEPDIIIEITGKHSIPKNSSLKIMEGTCFGNTLIKNSLIQMKGYKLLTFNYLEFEYIEMDEAKFEAYVIEKVQSYL